jgi:hypothetical protein
MDWWGSDAAATYFVILNSQIWADIQMHLPSLYDWGAPKLP